MTNDGEQQPPPDYDIATLKDQMHDVARRILAGNELLLQVAVMNKEVVGIVQAIGRALRDLPPPM